MISISHDIELMATIGSIRGAIRPFAPKTAETTRRVASTSEPVTTPSYSGIKGPDLDVYIRGRNAVETTSLQGGIRSLSSLSSGPGKNRYFFPSQFVNQFGALLAKANMAPPGLASKEAEIQGFLNTILMRDDKPHTAAYVRSVMESPAALNTVLNNMSKYIRHPTNAILPDKVVDSGAVFDRLGFLPFLGSKDTAFGLTSAMKRDLDLSGQALRNASAVASDVTIIGQGPTGAVIARGLSDSLPDDARVSVVGGETTFSAGDQWFLNSPNRAVTATGKDGLGVGGPLNPIDDRLGDADLSGRYYAEAGVIDQMTKLSLHSSGVPVLTETIQSISKDADGYVLNTPNGALKSRVVVLSSGLGDKYKPLDTPEATEFIQGQAKASARAIESAKSGYFSGSLPKWSSTLDNFRLRDQLANPLSIFAATSPVKTLNVWGARGEGALTDYANRAAYRTGVLAKDLQPSDANKLQQVIGVVGFGDSSRTWIESVTGLGPDNRTPRQLGINPKIVWFVGERGPRDCAEFYTGDLLRGFDGFSAALQSLGAPDLASLLRKRLKSVDEANDADAVATYLTEFSNLLTTKKPELYFDELLREANLSAADKKAAFGVFLKERDAIRPRYNQLVIPIEKGQIELVRGRVATADTISDSVGRSETKTLVKTTVGQQFVFDQVIDGRGNLNDTAQVVRSLNPAIPTGVDPFEDPTFHDVVTVFDADGNAKPIMKKLKGEEVYLTGPASGVVNTNTTNVGANKVSIFLNRNINELSADAIGASVVDKISRGFFGSSAKRQLERDSFDSAFTNLLRDRELRINASEVSEASVEQPQPRNAAIRSPLERDPLAHQAGLNELLDRVRVKPNTGSGVRITISQAPGGYLRIEGPTAMLDDLKTWATSPAGADYLNAALSEGRSSVAIERSLDPQGRLVPILNWL